MTYLNDSLNSLCDFEDRFNMACRQEMIIKGSQKELVLGVVGNFKEYIADLIRESNIDDEETI